jgi:hypothetical protein
MNSDEIRLTLFNSMCFKTWIIQSISHSKPNNREEYWNYQWFFRNSTKFIQKQIQSGREIHKTFFISFFFAWKLTHKYLFFLIFNFAKNRSFLNVCFWADLNFQGFITKYVPNLHFKNLLFWWIGFGSVACLTSH